MDIDIFALACIAALYPVFVLIRCHPLASLYSKYWRQTKIMH
jgi:hypothetical protein